MSVKHWSFAGLMLTYWCNANCASCYLCCGPRRREWFELDEALSVWRSLVDACPHGCRIHIGGGEPFGRWELLIEICRRAKCEGLVPLEKVETNAFWATSEKTVRDRLAALDDAGMRKLVISADPYHQQFVPIEQCRLAARVAEGILGPERVQVRWRDWLADGFNTGGMGESERRNLFVQYAERGRDRLNGRGAELIAGLLRQKPISEFSGRDLQPCSAALLRSRHVHVGPDGLVMPGVCAGIVLGRLHVTPGEACGPLAGASAGQGSVRNTEKSVAAVWQRLNSAFGNGSPDQRRDDTCPVLSVLVSSGSIGLLTLARREGFVPAGQYAGKCHLCWDIRRFLAEQGAYQQELGPGWLYGLEGPQSES